MKHAINNNAIAEFVCKVMDYSAFEVEEIGYRQFVLNPIEYHYWGIKDENGNAAKTDYNYQPIMVDWRNDIKVYITPQACVRLPWARFKGFLRWKERQCRSVIVAG